MRVRRALPVVGLFALAPVAYFLFPRPVEGDGIGDFDKWTPGLKEISGQVGVGDRGRFDDTRHLKFTRMFQERFRNHDHAVGLKFLDDNTLKAMFAPAIPKWDMARVAVQAESEAHAVFGGSFNVDIYETYITAPMRKLGELRRKKPDGPVHVRFDPKFTVIQLNERRIKEAAERRRRPAPVAGLSTATPLQTMSGRR